MITQTPSLARIYLQGLGLRLLPWWRSGAVALGVGLILWAGGVRAAGAVALNLVVSATTPLIVFGSTWDYVDNGSDQGSPWTDVNPGVNALTAVATANGGAPAGSFPVTVTVNGNSDITTNAVIAQGSLWSYLDDGSDQGTGWIDFGFDDSTWAQGPAQLGYGDGDEATTVSFGPDAGHKYITTYFRRFFTVDDPSLVLSATLNLLRDDGAIAYINGQEVFRLSMPEGPVDYTTYAVTASEYSFESTSVSPSVLLPGTNIMAVEIHQCNASSSDLSLEMELIGVFSAPTNFRPVVTITNPPNNITVAAPASFTVAAAASDRDGTVVRVEFFANGSRLGEDTTSPYAVAWPAVAAGSYNLTAVATDNVRLANTSSVVQVTVSADVAPPRVLSQSPTAGPVTNLSQITVTFSKGVLGVDAADLLINGTPAAAVSGGGAVYTFSFPQPPYGPVAVAWAVNHGITDLFTPPHAFDRNGTGATWQHQLNDVFPPLLVTLDPPPGSTVAALTTLTALFNEPVTGVGAADLRINSVPASAVTGSGVGPYVFGFAQPAPGMVQMAWVGGHGIQDSWGNPFAGGSWSYTLDTNMTGVIFNEIMYHPSSENILEEYVELFNKGGTPVRLVGWRLRNALDFTFPDVTIPAGGYLVVAADLATFTNKYPGVTNVVGGWLGLLSNRGEGIELEDASGRRLNRVAYADEGDWALRDRGPVDRGYRGWVWFREHDGQGRSLELVQPKLPNESGQNWAASLVDQGTPGRPNSVLSNNIPPLILEARHFPVVPTPADPILITARIVDESVGGLGVRLYHRLSSSTPPVFSVVTMHDDGLNGDAVGMDGLYSYLMPAQANDAIVEFHVEASDSLGRTRTWPAAARQEDGTFAQTANALFQVDNRAYTGTQPVYKLIMTALERQELANLLGVSDLQGPNAQMNGTFISLDGTGVEFRYLVGIRNRGHGTRRASPPNYRVNFRSDQLWKDVEAENLNSQQPHMQHLGSVIAREAGAAGGRTTAVQVRVNNANPGPRFGVYAAVEVIDADWAQHHFPFDGDGNAYRIIRDIPPPDFSYRDENKNSYTNTWFKTSNESEDDWTDLVGMLRVAGINNTTPFTTENVRQVINVEQWLTHLAVMNLFGNGETGLNTGYNDDYYTYRGRVDPRFILIYWDLDQILGQGGSTGTGSDIFSATAGNGAGAAMSRFMHWPDFEPIYYRILHELVHGTFSQQQFDALVDQTLSYADPGTRISIKNWMTARRDYVLSVLPSVIVGYPPVATLAGIPRSPTPLRNATVQVGGEAVTHYRFSLNGAAYGAETAVSTPIVLSSLANGSNVLAVVGKNLDGTWQSENSPTVRAWVVNTAWLAVRLSEILARNDSAVNHGGTFPDIIELYNEGATAISLAGLRLTDDPANPSKYSFPAGTSLAAGQYLVVYASNPDGTPEWHTGFGLNQDGDGVYLFDSVARGGALLDAVEFGMQVANLSLGRVRGGDWVLTSPTPTAPNAAYGLGDPANLRINEWLTFAQSPFADDFVELYNPNARPVALGGLYLTDQPIGAPARHAIAPLSFIASNGFRTFIADGQPGAGPGHVDFQLAAEQGEIGLFSSTLRQIDVVIYGPQEAGISSGLCPNGSLQVTRLFLPTPGVANACPVLPPPAQVVSFLRFDDSWSYDDSGTDLGTGWREPAYDDSGWLEGPGALGYDVDPVPEPIRTQFGSLAGKITYYFRKRFVVGTNLNLTSVELTHEVDDGAVFYLNGQEIGNRFTLPAGDIDYQTLALQNIGAATLQSFSFLPSVLLPGTNVLAVELHQSNPGSGDLVFALQLNGLIVTNNPAVAGVVLNEVLANNQSLEEPDGSKPDWVEIYNPSSNAVDLAEMALTDDLAQPGRWIFPPGSVVPALKHLRVRLDTDLPPSDSNVGFGLKTGGGSVYLLNRPAEGGGVLSAITYGIQAADWSIGRVPDGSTNWLLNIPTSGSPNLAASLGDPQLLKINEWMAAPASGEDWFELYNPNLLPVDLSGFHLTDDFARLDQHQIPPLSFIGSGANGFCQFIADNNLLLGADHVNFKLSAGGEALGLSTPSGVVIDALTFGPQDPGVSEGPLPDGSFQVARFYTTPTPGRSNFLPLSNVVVNEVLTHSDPPLEDAIELHNPSGDDVDISGWYLSDSQDNLRKYQVPPNTILRAGGYGVFYESAFNGDHPGEPFSLSSVRGDEVYLSEAVSTVLTGYRAHAEFGPAENGVSFGRYPTSVGFDFVAMSQRTFGRDNPSSTNEFELGTGATNSIPKVGPVVISEVNYHPPGTNDHLEFIEIHNITAQPVPLFDPGNPDNPWRLRDAVRFDFPPNTTLPPNGYLVVVSFSPQADPGLLAGFQASYGTNALLIGPYQGKLDNAGDSVELRKPDEPQTLPGPDFGVVPYILVDRVAYADTTPWPITADGLGDSLQRIDHARYGNDPVNWTADLPKPGAASGGVLDSDGDGLPNDWETANGLNPNDPSDTAGDPDHDSLNNLGEYLGGTDPNNADTDADGMPDGWEVQAGLNPRSPADAGLDADNDGFSNRAEYQSGTDPNNPASYLQIDQVRVSAAQAQIDFLAVAGKTYTVQYRDALTSGLWQKVADVLAQPTTGPVTVPHAANTPQRYYRLITPALP